MIDDERFSPFVLYATIAIEPVAGNVKSYL